MCVLISLQLLSEPFLILRRIQRDTAINVQSSPCKVPVILCRILINFELKLQIFEKCSNIRFH